jgi:hypothetical protein
LFKNPAFNMMRLLRYGSDGELELVSKWFGSDKVPPYAILSHTWEDGQEVLYEDMIKKQGQNKTGYDKLVFCAQQAKLDNLQYFWVDTCCIDKSSSAELTEAINSMYKWYRNAARCYVYLSDVTSTDFASPNNFQTSRWFTRGWTLQELLAPTFVQFFTRDHVLLGDRVSLVQKIADTTKIPLPVLKGHPFLHYTYDERIGWAVNRQTKCEEDEAYSLLGIMGVNLPLVYGEGREGALRRLRTEFQTIQATLTGVERAGNVHWTVTQTVNSLFTGRSELLNRITEALRYDDVSGAKEQKRLVITGLGGQGKSEICVKVASLMREKYAVIPNHRSILSVLD